MITKDTFIAIVGGIKDQLERERELSKTLEQYLNSDFVTQISSGFIDIVIDALDSEFKDETSFVGWWLFDCPGSKSDRPGGLVVYNEKEYDINNLSELYDFLCIYNDREKIIA